MKNERLKILNECYVQDPHDPFNAYALAMEYVAIDPLLALKYFEELLSNHPNYLPTYYHVAQLYFDLGNNTQAETTYEKGITLAIELKQEKALRELKGAYQRFRDELD